MTELSSADVIVDGELLHVVDEASLRRLSEDASAQDAAGQWLRATATVVRAHRELSLAWHVFGARRARSWLVLFQAPDRWIRGHLEHLVCSQCKARSLAVNPTIADLHWSAPDEHAAREASWLVPTVPCPRCGTAFDRQVIWAEIEEPIT